jgi:hypothetical protein
LEWLLHNAGLMARSDVTWGMRRAFPKKVLFHLLQKKFLRFGGA